MIFVVTIALACLVCLISFVQLLFLESQRLRTRDYPSLQFFRETLQEAIGLEIERGAITFSLLKHSLLVLCGSAFPFAVTHAADWARFLEGFAIGWLTMLSASYFLPQILYRRSSAQWLLPLVPVVRFLALLVSPLLAFLRFLESLYELSAPADEQEKEASPAEEIEALMAAGEEGGILEKEDRKLIQSVVAFGDKRVREVMTPRPLVVSIDANATLDDLRRLVKNEQYSRVPVHEGDLDRMLGFVHVRDLYEIDPEHRAGMTVRDLARKMDGVPEFMPVSQLLKQMQNNGTHMVYVVNEYGSFAGVATMEDLVEEILGEIRDEHEPAHDVTVLEGGGIEVSGSFDVDHLADHFGYRPGKDSEAATVGGLVTEWMGAVPRTGDSVDHEGLRIEVIASDGRRVERVRIRAIPKSGEQETEAE